MLWCVCVPPPFEMCEAFSPSVYDVYTYMPEDLLLGSSPRLYREISLSLAHMMAYIYWIHDGDGGSSCNM